MALASVVAGEVGNLAGSGVLVTHELNTVDGGFGTTVGAAGVRHVHSFHAGVAVLVEESAVVELDTVIDETHNNTFALIALGQAIVGAVPSLVGISDALGNIGEQACVACDAHLLNALEHGNSLKLVDRNTC